MMFSIIIPAYNSERCLSQCIDLLLSISNHTDYQIEIIIVDDGSSDFTAAICDENGITCVHKKNEGVSKARNCGLDIANGEYVIFIDSDDSIDPKKLAECMRTIEENKDLDMLCYGISFDYYHKGKVYRSDLLLPPFNGVKSQDECLNDIKSVFEQNCLTAIWNKIIRRSRLSNLHFREDMFMYEDLEYSLRILKKCKAVYFYPEPVYHYVQPEKPSQRIKRVNDIKEITDKISMALDELECDKAAVINPLTECLRREKLDSLTAKEVRNLYPDQANKIMMKRVVATIRHRVANFIKQNIGDFRKW